MRLRTRLLAAAVAVTALGACSLPTALRGPSDLTVSALLSRGGPMRLTDLKPGGEAVSVSVGGAQPAFLMFNSRRTRTETLAVDIQRPSAYRVQSAGTEPAGFEMRLRRLERGWVPPGGSTYRVQQAARPYQLGDSERFWVIESAEDQQLTETQVTASAHYVGQHCYVFVDDDFPVNAQVRERLQQIGQAFDTQIFPTNTRLFGEPLATGVNGDPRITLLISPAVGGYGQDATIGYFTLRDLFTPEQASDVPALKRSNRRLMLYVSSMVVGRGQPSDYLGTIAHEFEHLINASQKLSQPQGAPRPEEVWLDEALAMYAMEANGYGLGGSGGVVFSHVHGYQSAPSLYSLTHWDLNPDGSAYGAGYLFAAYLADRFGETLFKELVDTPEVGLLNMETALRARGTSFAEVFSDWTAANMLDDTGLTSDSRFQYKTLNMLGQYGGRRLRGVRLSPVSLPNTGALELKPYSAHYYYVPRGEGGTFRFTMRGEEGAEFGGLVVSP